VSGETAWSGREAVRLLMRLDTPLGKGKFGGTLRLRPLPQHLLSTRTAAAGRATVAALTSTSSRNFFENDLHLHHLNQLVQLDVPVKGERWEVVQNEWHWPCVQHTLFVKYMNENNKLFYNSPHEGLCFGKEDCILLIDFLKKHSTMRGELFQSYCPAEEFALQTIVKSMNGHFYDIGNGCCSNERNMTNNPEKGILKFMYKTNREDFTNQFSYLS
jgi:hypothetical protein